MSPEELEESVICRHVTLEYELVITCPSDLLEESSVYQDIFQKGERHGYQKGLRRGLRKSFEQRFGKLSHPVRQQIEQLVVEQLEALCEARLDFRSKDDLTRWLKQHAPAR